MHLALNGHKTSSTGKRDPREHREWVEELVELLFQVKNDDFGEEITSKPYPKYVYEPVSKGPKSEKIEAFLENIDGFSSDHIYGENPLKKRGYCFFCPKKDQKKRKSTNFLFEKTLKLSKEDLVEIKEKKESKTKRFRSKQTKEWCFDCQKFICKDCWSLYH